MKLSADEVRQIANLARLKLSEEEVAKYSEQLTDILGYIEQLAEVDTSQVEPTAQVTGLTNALAADEVGNQPRRDELLKGAPAVQGGYLKVPVVFEDRQA